MNFNVQAIAETAFAAILSREGITADKMSPERKWDAERIAAAAFDYAEAFVAERDRRWAAAEAARLAANTPTKVA